MEKKPLLSVIIPVYNVEPYLRKCVESILEQTYQSLEIILINDGSKDNSGTICDEFAALDNRIHVIHQDNGGLSSARNAGLDRASGEYITFVDSDDWIEPDSYEHLLGLMEKYDVKLVCGGNIDVDGRTGTHKLGLTPKKEEKITAEEMVGRMFLWDGCDSSACDKVYHRSLLENFRYPLGKICEDVALTYKIVLGTDYVAMSDKPFYFYYQRPGSISKTAVSEKTFDFPLHTKEIYDYICTNHPGIQDQARYLRVKSLTHGLLLLDSAEKQVRNQFIDKYRANLRYLRKHTAFLLRCPWFGKKEKITYLLLVLGLYRWLKPIFTKRKSE